MNRPKRYFILFIIALHILLCTSCNNKAKLKTQPLFNTLSSNSTGINFSNTLMPTPQFNLLKYMYYFNGAGVGAGDFNNDGKIDLFFASNQGQNSLFLNEGNMHFKDATIPAKIPTNGGWSTGVSIVDINNDGLLDIYVCQVGNFKTLNGKNQLLICLGIKDGIPYYENEIEKYGLSFCGFSTQASFFDYDKDGDLDMFLLNHSVNHDGNFLPRNTFYNTYDTLAGDQFFINNNGHFVNATKQSGINSTKIGYGLGIAVSDINLDGWPDIYIGNDFHENDYLYINQKNGTFKEELNNHIMHTSQFSMGVDVADINNDAFPDIISMDMLPSDPKILKRSLAEDDYQTYKGKQSYGYNNQYARNNLQLNLRNGMFAETGYYSGVFATDWSWSSLWLDFDNDGLKDLFISNGIPKRLNDLDYITYMINDAVQEKLNTNTLNENDLALINKFPEIKLPNRFFKNVGNAKFEDVSNDINNSPATFSNGAVYADLDNDGDLDIVVNNIADKALVYQNNNANNKTSITLLLKGSKENINAIGAKCFIFQNKEISSFEKFNSKGFLSSMEIPLQISYGKGGIDSLIFVWPDNTCQKVSIDSNKNAIALMWQKGLPKFDYATILNYYKPQSKKLYNVTALANIKYLHVENDFNEYNREILLPKMFSTEGPALAVGDFNNDGLQDIFVGSSKWKVPELILQNKLGKFEKSEQIVLENDSTYEDVDASFADVNNDGFNDLIVASGGNEFYAKEQWMQPRVYLNDKHNNLVKVLNPFPNVFTTQSCIKPLDFNNDGFIDFFIGSRTVPYAYGVIPNSYLMQNDGTGHFIDVTNKIAKGVSKIGFVTNATVADINGDKQPDLLVTLEWGGIKAFLNNHGNFNSSIVIDKLGWWNFLLPVDVDNDGDIDFIAGNQGQNCRISPSVSEPVTMYYNDFDDNGTKEQVISFYQQGQQIPLASKMDLEKQIPFIKKKYILAENYASASFADIFGDKKLQNSTVFKANYFSNSLLINDGKGNFTVKELPWQAQLSCLKDAVIVDANGDGLPDILTAGNFYEQSMPLNRADANFGTILINRGSGNFSTENINGIQLKTQVRHILPIIVKGIVSYVIANNNDSLMIIQ